MRVDVAFTPDEAVAAPTAIVADVLRASSTIVQALDSGYRRILCCAEVDDAFALRREFADAVLAGERFAARIPGFDLGNSPREVLEPRGETLILTTTNGTRAVIAAASRCEAVLVGSLLNLQAVVAAAQARRGDVTVVCAGVDGGRALDDVYCAGRLAELLGGAPSARAGEAMSLTRSYASAEEALAAAANPRQADLAEDIGWCAQENVCTAVPALVQTRGAAVELRVL